MIRAPVTPIGWPTAMPPPLKFTLFSGTSSSRDQTAVVHVLATGPLSTLGRRRSVVSSLVAERYHPSHRVS